MDDTRLLQLAARGAAELPNDPFRAFAAVELTDPRKLTARQRRAQGAQAMALDAALFDSYQGGGASG